MANPEIKLVTQLMVLVSRASLVERGRAAIDNASPPDYSHSAHEPLAICGIFSLIQSQRSSLFSIVMLSHGPQYLITTGLVPAGEMCKQRAHQRY